eukprot:CAMPEP_0198310532 /NCGR_PEP_ID=MMETSP1450-20131203/2590_1 /TAXON_ID=753684 ORGANISM="Madagascaria erythrocladiodes, Strain CCMP3234" /NCGR_SAMPLE_ID=MMETSP1450 /ASSEMBLY_ACC=CAM_ASM_001115 /LENGTH=696 /DNA_ID=CAMNT_0044013371 /DNA_START=33 /DNA_END=2123 /DNA_ORIENTATION=-
MTSGTLAAVPELGKRENSVTKAHLRPSRPQPTRAPAPPAPAALTPPKPSSTRKAALSGAMTSFALVVALTVAANLAFSHSHRPKFSDMMMEPRTPRNLLRVDADELHPLGPAPGIPQQPRSNALLDSRAVAALSGSDQAVYTELHDMFYVPDEILAVMTPDVKRNILARLRRAAAASSTSLAPSTPLLLLVQLTKEFGDRLRALGTAMAYARNTERVLVVLWERDAHFVHRFETMFHPVRPEVNLVVVDDIPKGFRPPFIGSSDWAHFWFSYFDYTLNPPSPVQQRRDLAAIRNVRRHLFIRTDKVLLSDYAPMTLAKELLGTLDPTSLARDAVIAATKVGKYLNVSDDYAGTLLHDSYAVPWDFVRHMDGGMRRRLLDQFSELEAKVPYRRPRMMAVHLHYGLGNRIRALGSAMAFAALSKRVLVVVWEADAHLEGVFEEFFLNDFVVLRSLPLSWPVKMRGDHAYTEFHLFNLMRKDNPKITSAGKFWLTDDERKHIYIKTAYVIKSKMTGNDALTKAATSPISLYARKLLPVMDVQKLVERQVANGLSSMIGVHIRGKTIEKDITNVNPDTEYTKSSSDTTNYWRKTTQLPVFVDKIKTIDNASQSFYVAADSIDSVYFLEKAFPGRIFYIPRRCDDRGAGCLHYALADILCLSKTKYLLGSYWSSFTEAAIRLGGIKVYLAGVDFGKPTGSQ